MFDQVLKNTKQTITYRFIKQYKANFGEAIYISGNIKQLGNWNPHRSIKMACSMNSHWTAEVIIPIGASIQFKYFLGPFDMNQSSKSITWLGNQNSKLKIDHKYADKFEEKNKRQLKIMSFNIRFENQRDQKEFSWTNRRDNCVELMLDVFPDFIGVQEPKTSQRRYLMQKVGQFYNYYGKPRNLIDDEESGIFVRKDKFGVIEDGYIWINEKKEQGKIGFGARLPRYYTYLVVAPFEKGHSWLLIINTHLDHETHQSKLQGIRYISETIKTVNERYNQVKNVFVTGDFNTSDDDQIFTYLFFEKELLPSMRYVLPEQNSDHGATFNGFSKLLKYIDKTMRFFNLDPGATIDHIFFRSQDYIPLSFQCLRREDKIVSDHFPILGIFSSQK